MNDMREGIFIPSLKINLRSVGFIRELERIWSSWFPERDSRWDQRLP